MRIKKTCIFFIFFLFELIYLSALDFGFTTSFLNYNSINYDPSFAISFDIKENLANELAIEAKLSQSDIKTYTAQSTAHYRILFFSLGGGIMYDIRDSIIAPGFIADARLYFKNNHFGISYYASFSPENLLKNFSQNAEFYIFIQNNLSSLSSSTNISYIQSDLLPYNLILNSSTEISARNEKLPIMLGMLISHDILTNTDSLLNLDLSFRLGGKFTLNLKKMGSYFICYEANVFRLSDTIQNTPSFNIHFGAMFKLES